MESLPAASEAVPADIQSRPVSEGVPELLTDLASKVIATKEGETFLYSDIEGNLDDRKEFGLGLYHRDTRFLSHYRMRLSGRDPVLLSSSAERAYMSYVDLTNPDLYTDDELAVPQQTLNVRRVRAINGRLFERVRVKNYNAWPVAVDVELDRKSTRLNSSHSQISYAVFCLKKKKRRRPLRPYSSACRSVS